MKKRLLLLGFALVTTPAMQAQNTIGEVSSNDAGVRGSVVLSGNGAHVLSGSQVSAGDGVAILKLERGGEVRICPKTNLSVSADPTGKALVLGLNAGSMEVDYTLNSAADLLITPDFRMQLISPGTFHLAISVAPSGDTCLRSLPGDDAATFIAEMMGDGSYQLSPGKNVMFRAGRISGATEAPPACGCPAFKPVPKVDTSRPAVVPPTPDAPPATGAPQKAGEPHLEVESSFVYHGDQAVQDYYASVARLSLSTDNSGLALALLPEVGGPAARSKPLEKKKGRLHRFGGFLGRLFRR